MRGTVAGRVTRVLVTGACLAAVVGIAVADAANNPVIRFGAVRVLPVLAAGYWGMTGAGVAVAVASALADLFASYSLGVGWGLPVVRSGVELGVYLVCLSIVKSLLSHRQAVVELRLQRARIDRQRLAVLEDRQRLARDLHDTVVQDLIAIGMQLDSQNREITAPRLRSRHASVIEQLIETVQRLRALAFDLRVPMVQGTVSATLRKIVQDAARVVGHVPALVVDGPVDTLPEAVTTSAAAVLREALSNVARHAHATRTTVAVVLADGYLTVSVEDNGTGPSRAAPEGEGLHNMRRRAVDLSGTVQICPVSPHGTRLVWQVPVSVPIHATAASSE